MTNNVDLQEFIKQSIIDILSGIQGAKQEFHNNGNCIIAPGTFDGEPVQNENIIEFEIETISTKECDGRIKISVISGGLSTNSQSKQVIKFGVPVFMSGLKFT